MIPSPEKIERIAYLRQKAAMGELTDEEVKEAINFLRGERLAMPPSKTSAKKAAAAINVDDMLGELGL
jgi:uncharacterized protein YnzC (UPF0291/DUF896 family)